MSTYAVMHTCSINLGVVKILYCMVALIYLSFMWWFNSEKNISCLFIDYFTGHYQDYNNE